MNTTTNRRSFLATAAVAGTAGILSLPGKLFGQKSQWSKSPDDLACIGITVDSQDVPIFFDFDEFDEPIRNKIGELPKWIPQLPKRSTGWFTYCRYGGELMARQVRAVFGSVGQCVAGWGRALHVVAMFGVARQGFFHFPT